MKKKTYLIIISISIIIGVILGFAIYKISLRIKENTKDENSPKVIIENLLKEVNGINKDFIDNNLSNDVSFQTENGNICKLYTGENFKESLSRIENLYAVPYNQMGLYYKIKNEVETEVTSKNNTDDIQEEELYICLPETCKLKDIENYNIISEEENRISIQVDDQEIVFRQLDNTWKIVFPVAICQ